MIKTITNWCDLPTPMGNFRMYDSGDDGVRIISYGDINTIGEKPLLRIHSSCLASEVFGATDCDCADQLREAMKLIAHEESGIIVHLYQEGRGQGLSRKIKAVHLMQYKNLDTFDAFEYLKYDQDTRSYASVVRLLNHLDISKVRLISNNPRKLAFLNDNGIEAKAINTHPNIRPENTEYLRAKNAKLGHSLPLDTNELEDIKFYHSDQPWGELSNFSRHSIFIKNKIWPTVEHYYQSQKFSDIRIVEEIRCAATPALAKQLARDKINKNDSHNWAEIKLKIMLEGLLAKFSQHPDLTALLISSGKRELREHTENDVYWGDGGDGTGMNKLGELLMQLRSEFNTERSVHKKVG